MNIIHFLTKIAVATENGRIVWKEGDRDHLYEVRSDSNVLQIWRWTDDDSGLPGYTFVVRNNETFVDSIHGDKYDENFTKLENMFNAARRVALKVNDQLDEIAAEFESSFGL